MQRISIAERLERNSIPEPNSGCRLWLGSVSKTSGHGRMKVNGKWLSPHRVAWSEKNGPIPPGVDALHKCDVPSCIETDHLWLGTHGDNMRDMASKGRWRGGASLFTSQTAAAARRKSARRPVKQTTAPTDRCNQKE